MLQAQKALNNCLLGNTTIHANSTSDSDAAAIVQQLGVGGGNNSSGGGPQLAVTSTPTRGNTPNSSNLVREKNLAKVKINLIHMYSGMLKSELVWISDSRKLFVLKLFGFRTFFLSESRTMV